MREGSGGGGGDPAILERGERAAAALERLSEIITARVVDLVAIETATHEMERHVQRLRTCTWH